MPTYIIGTIDQKRLLRNEYLAPENHILRAEIKGRLVSSDAEKGLSRVRSLPGTAPNELPIALDSTKNGPHDFTSGAMPCASLRVYRSLSAPISIQRTSAKFFFSFPTPCSISIFRRFRITAMETAEVPQALQHTWSGHARTHVSERYKKLLRQREWRLEWAEKVGMGFDLPVQPVGLRGLLIQFPKVG